MIKYCWLTEHLFSPMVVVVGKRGMDKIPADLRPAFNRAAAAATQHQRAIADDKGRQAVAELTRLGVGFTPMQKTDRETVRRDMEAKLWSGFAKEYPETAPLFSAIAAAR